MGIATIAKAIVAGASAFATAITVATGDGHVTSVEWVLAIVSGLVAGFVTWEVPNAPAAPVWTLHDVPVTVNQGAFTPTHAPTTSTVRAAGPTDPA